MILKKLIQTVLGLFAIASFAGMVYLLFNMLVVDYETEDENVDQIISDFNIEQLSFDEWLARQKHHNTNPNEAKNNNNMEKPSQGLKDNQQVKDDELQSTINNERNDQVANKPDHMINDSHLPSNIDIDDIVDVELSESVRAMIANTSQKHDQDDNPSRQQTTDQQEGNSVDDLSREASETTSVTVNSILSWYEPKFHSLQADAKQKLDELLYYALDEYNGKQANNEKISYTYFIQKYTKAIRELEANTDEAFNTIYTSLQADLSKHGFKEDKAITYKEIYQASKKELEQKVMKEVMSRM